MMSGSFQNSYRDDIYGVHDIASKIKSFSCKKLIKKTELKPVQPSVTPGRGD